MADGSNIGIQWLDMPSAVMWWPIGYQLRFWAKERLEVVVMEDVEKAGMWLMRTTRDELDLRCC